MGGVGSRGVPTTNTIMRIGMKEYKHKRYGNSIAIKRGSDMATGWYEAAKNLVGQVTGSAGSGTTTTTAGTTGTGWGQGQPGVYHLHSHISGQVQPDEELAKEKSKIDSVMDDIINGL